MKSTAVVISAGTVTIDGGGSGAAGAAGAAAFACHGEKTIAPRGA